MSKKPRKEEVELIDEKKGCNHTHKGEECDVHGKKECPAIEEAVRIPAKTGNIIMVHLSWRGKYYGIKMFFPTVKKPSRSEVQDQIEKVYPGAKVQSYQVSESMSQDNHFSMQNQQHGQERKERKNQVDSTKKDANLTKERILEATLKHQARRLETPVAHHFVLE